MLPRLGAKYILKIETVSKARQDYSTAEHLSSGQPKAPALMLGDALLPVPLSASWWHFHFHVFYWNDKRGLELWPVGRTLELECYYLPCAVYFLLFPPKLLKGREDRKGLGLFDKTFMENRRTQ